MNEPLYKLTDQNGRTKGGMEWGPGVTHTVTGEPKLCSATVLHAYRSPLLAVLLDAAHGAFGPTGKLWEAEGEVVIEAPDKVGCQTLTTLCEIERPIVTTNQRVRFAILCAQAVIGERCPKWNRWAEDWLSGKDRTRSSANAAYAADAAYATAYANAAAYAAYATAYANAAAYAAYAAAYAAYATAYAAYAAAYAAYATAYAAYANLNLQELAEQAIRDEQ